MLKYTHDDWWQDVLQAYDDLKNMGFNEVAVAGLSLGGIFSLKLGYTMPVKGIVPMCAPLELKQENSLYLGVLAFARDYKKKEGKSPEQIEKEMASFDTPELQNLLKRNQRLMEEIKNNLHRIKSPLLVVQAVQDQMVNIESARMIYNGVSSQNKQLKWYENPVTLLQLIRKENNSMKMFWRF